MSSFNKIHIEITNICNLQCSFCPELIRPKHVMDLEIFEAILKEVAPLTKLVALHLMGDPLVHPKLLQIAELCEKYQVKIFLVSNGVLLKESHFEALLHPAFRQINFSLHSFADNFGDKDPIPYLDRIFRFTELAFQKRPRLFINYRMWNLDREFGHKESNKVLLKQIESRFQVSLEEKVLTREKKYLHVTNHLSLHFDTEFTWPGIELPVLGEVGTCHGLSSHFGILVDGTVVPCCLDKEAVINLGNVLTTPLKEILKSPRAQTMLMGFQKNLLKEELCKRCQYIERFNEFGVKNAL